MPRLKIDVPKELRKEVSLDKLDDKDLMSKLHFRGVDVKRDNRLNEAIECYVRKIPLLVERNKIDKDPLIEEKIARLKEKLGCCIKELELRDAQKVDRTAVLHDTIYYIDLTNGNDDNDGLAANNDHSWLTIEKYTTTTVRTAGDIAYVRANTTQTLGAAVAFDEDGTYNAPISIIGCDAVTNDPWGDASDVKPTINGNAGNHYLFLSGDDYWHIERLSFTNTQYSGISIQSSYNEKIVNCAFSGTRGIQGSNEATAIITSCTFAGCVAGINFDVTGCLTLNMYDCTFDNSTNGIYMSSGTNKPVANIYMYNCQFGQSVANGAQDINLETFSNAIIYGQNCKLQKADVLIGSAGYRSYVYFEDWQGVKGDSFSKTYYWKITNDSDVQIDSLDSIKLEQTIQGGLGYPTRQPCLYKLWLASGSYTISVKARETTAWANDPNSSAFFFRASYLNHASNATRTFVDSAQALSGTDEITFTMAVAPAQDGFVYVTPYLLAYESGKSINYSIKPSVT